MHIYQIYNILSFTFMDDWWNNHLNIFRLHYGELAVNINLQYHKHNCRV